MRLAGLPRRHGNCARPRTCSRRACRSACGRRCSRPEYASTSARPCSELSRDAVATTTSGTVRARSAVLAVNSATAGFAGYRHALAVASSHMVITEPVPDVIEEIGWTDGENIHDCRTLLHYLRTTNDGRIALGWGGGRMGVGGRHSERLDIDPEAARHAVAALRRFFPQLVGRQITHAWGGPIDVSPTHLPIFGSRGSVHHGFGFTGNGVGPDLPRRRDPRAARARPPRRAHRTRDRRARPQAASRRSRCAGPAAP